MGHQPSRREFVVALGAALSCRQVPSERGVSDGVLGPHVLVLGTAQDGGLPQLGCYSDRCNLARSDPRYVASLALVNPDTGKFYLVDASPDITRQLDLLDTSDFQLRASRRRPFDGIFLTHAHIGHYLGLALLGREGLGTSETPVYCTRRMEEYLRTNGPWSLLVDEGRLVFPDVPIDDWFVVDEWLTVRMIPVPHRPEFSDAVGFIFRGPRASVLYLPDIDRWESWEYSVEEIVEQVDVALLDGSFFSGEEVPGRRIEDIPHPLIPHSMDLLQARVDSGSRVIFIHLNNTNPAHDDGPELANITSRGFEVARQGMRVPL